MVGIPKSINSKADVLYCHSLALSGEIDRTKLKEKLQGLLSDEQTWSFKAEVPETYTPLAGEKVVTETDIVTGATKHSCYELVDNPYAQYLVMGFSKDELTNLINQL